MLKYKEGEIVKHEKAIYEIKREIDIDEIETDIC